MNKKFSKIKRGFSLIEVLVSLFVLSIGITAIAVLMVNYIKDLQTSKNQIIASQLAQEGIELVRNLKDNNNMNTNTAFCNFGTGSTTCSNLRIDKDGLFDGGADKKLYLNGDFYTHTAGTSTKFFRRIDFSITGAYASSPNSTRIMTVTSYVTWNNTGFAAMALPAACNVANKCVSVISVLQDE